MAAGASKQGEGGSPAADASNQQVQAVAVATKSKSGTGGVPNLQAAAEIQSAEASAPPQNREAGCRPILVELFSGCCSLSQAAQACGWEVVPIDWAGSEHKPRIHRVDMDLTASRAESVVFGLLAKPNVRHIHLGLPCGTGSRAREIPIRAEDLARGVPEVRPLRTDEEPLWVALTLSPGRRRGWHQPMR